MRITRKYECPEVPTVMGNEIPGGTVFDGIIGACEGPFLRSYDRIIALENPTTTWVSGTNSPAVASYRPLDVELVIHGPAEGEGP